MSKEIKQIDIVLENCEVIVIPRNEIGEFSLSGVEKVYSRIASNSISDYLFAKSFYIEIHKDANTLDNVDENFREFGELPFDRLTKHHDITHVDLIFEDGSNEYICVDWSGESEYINDSQTTYHSAENGSLFIVVDRDKTVDDVFGSSLNDEEAYHWNFYRD
ncbi:hypothetical protein M3649_03585 [Ureibacillus chungkukjangi]|uniref:hypothetical protein n=1 Tax=Ureibacillus chungkukjangi TaxID=1202712 RepID=UPI00203DAA41|nr:hypothetical protein [Ureibacillus chungkukjangi]MCM3387212.1 hypothetical protein [Ureibacillus chungkukjangi]